MKIRLTLLTENDKQRPPELTEEKVKAAWQAVVNTMCLLSDSDDTCVVEKVEFVEEVILTQTEQKHGMWIRLSNDLAQCSECKDYIDNAISCGYNYCPNCGAIMDVRRE